MPDRKQFDRVALVVFAAATFVLTVVVGVDVVSTTENVDFHKVVTERRAAQAERSREDSTIRRTEKPASFSLDSLTVEELSFESRDGEWSVSFQTGDSSEAATTEALLREFGAKEVEREGNAVKARGE
jgi:hypothetical protein